MPRKARIDGPGALHHLIIRGIERREIFRSDYDRLNFLERLSVLIPETQTDCFAWVLIPNHVHLLLRTGAAPMSIFMNRLNPLRAGIVKGLDDLDRHQWSGHSALMNKGKRAWQNTDYVYGLFAEEKNEARRRYRQFVEDGLAQGNRPDGKSPQTVEARSLLCFWAHRKLGMSTVEIAGRLKLSQSAVSRLSRRGELLAKEKGLTLIESKRIKT